MWKIIKTMGIPDPENPDSSILVTNIHWVLEMVVGSDTYKSEGFYSVEPGKLKITKDQLMYNTESILDWLLSQKVNDTQTFKEYNEIKILETTPLRNPEMDTPPPIPQPST